MRLGSAPLLLSLLAMVAGCDHSPAGTGAVTETFPSAVGSSWTYRWHDLVNDTVDTVLVSIVGARELAGVGPVKVLAFEHPAWAETLHLSTRADTVEFLPQSSFPGNGARFLLPLAVGARWRGTNTHHDTCWVSSQEAVTVPLGRFPDALRLQETWDDGFRDSGWVVTWVVPGIGIVREYRLTLRAFPRGWYDRELIGYNLGGA